MAITVAELVVNITANNAQFTTILNQTQNSMKSIQAQSESMVASLSSGFLRAGGLITGAVTAPIAAISEMGRSFETELRRVAANTAMTDAELAKMRETVMDLGRNSAAPLADIAHGFEHAANFGFSAAESAKILDVALQGAVATGAKTEAVTNTLAGVMHQFGLSADQASVTLNTLKEAAGKGNLTLEEMVNVSGRVFSTAANLGLSLNEAAGAMSALTRAGFPASQASTQLVGALTHLVNPSKEVREELARLSKTTGVDLVSDFSQFGLQSKGLSGILQDVKKAVGDNTAEALKLFGGIRGGLGAMALMNNASQDYKNILVQLADTMGGKLTPIQDAYAREVNTLTFQIGELKNRLTLLGDALNNAFSGSQVGFVKNLNDAVDGLTRGFQTLDPAMQAAVATFLGAFAISGPILFGVGALVTLIGGPLTIAIVGVTAALSILAADWLSDNDKATSSTETLKQSLLELIPVLGLVADIMGVVANASFIAWQSSTAQIKATIQVVTGDWIGAMRTIDQSNKIFSKGLGNIWDELNGKWEGVLTKLVNSAFSASPGFSAAGRSNAQSYLSGLGIISGHNPFAVPVPTQAVAGPPTVGSMGQLTFPTDNWNRQAAAVGEDVGKHLAGGIGGGIKSGKGAIKAAVDETFNSVTDWFRSNNLGDLSKKVWDGLAKNVRDSLKSQADEFHAHKDAVQTWKATIVSLMLDLGFETAKSNNDIGVSFHKTADTIVIESARLSTSLRGITDGVGPAFDDLQRASAAATAGLVADSEKRAERYNAEQKSADDAFHALAVHTDQMARDIPHGLSVVLDAFVQLSGKAGTALLELRQKTLGWAHDIIGVVDTIPGAFGNAVRNVAKTIDQWLNFFNSVLALVHRFASDVPGSIGDMLSKIVGLFKGGGSLGSSITQSLSDWTKGIDQTKGKTINATNIMGSSIGKMSDLAKGAFAAAGSAAASFASSLAITASGGSKSMAILTGGITSAIAGFMASIATTGPIGAIVGGISFLGSVLGAIFGGPSAAEKARIEQQKQLQLQQLKDQVAKDANDIMAGALSNIQKALDLAPFIAEFGGVGKAQIQLLFKFMTRLVNSFVEMSKAWNAENLTKAKAAAENIGPVFESIAAVPAAAAAVLSSFHIEDSQFEVFFTNLDGFMSRFFIRSEAWVTGISKRAKKVADRLASVVGLINPFAEGIKNIVGLQMPTDADFNVWDVVLEKIVTHIGNLADKFDKSYLKTLQNFADKAQGALSIWKDATDAIRATVDVPVVSESSIDNVVNSITSFVNKLVAAAADMTTEGLAKASAIANSILPIAAAIKAWSEAALLIKDYTGVANDTWDKILSDFHRAIGLMTLMLNEAILFIPDAIKFEDTMKTIADHLKAGLDLLGGGLAAAASAFGGVVNAIQGGVPIGSNPAGGGVLGGFFASQSFGALGLAGGGSASSSASVSSAPAVHIHFHGTVIQDRDFENKVINAVVTANRKFRTV
jgi:TP901 family phage tail tape measure protein